MSDIEIDTNRRKFMLAAAGAIATSSLIGRSARADDAADAEGTVKKKSRTYCVFTKPFNSLSFDELADRVAELGFDGIEAPVRAGGHVQPEEVADRLPALVEALGKRNLKITIMASDINDPSDPLTEQVLRTAATLGIDRYRMKYFKYDLKQHIDPQIDTWHGQLRDLAAMNHEFGVQGLYQNHAGGTYFGAPIWDLRRALTGIAPADLGVAYDIRHAVAEGGTSWPITFQAIRPHIEAVYVKDFRWADDSLENVPLGQGRVPKRFFELLNATEFDGPISLHEEYLDHRKPELVPEHLAAIRQDIATLKNWDK